MTDVSPPVGNISDLNQEPEHEEFNLMNHTIPVTVDGPVQIHNLPSVSAGSRCWTSVGDVTPVRVANGDPRRRSMTLISLDEDFYVGATQSEVEQGYAALWPSGIPLTLTHSDPVYVLCAHDTNTTTISVLVENWAS